MTRSQLQLLGAVCLLVSWKVRDHSPITAQRLIEYTDYNVDLAALLVSAGNSAANRLICEVVQSRRRPLLGPSPG